MPTQILISPQLRNVLDFHHVTQYGPAYQGESVGLDLYYTGDQVLSWDVGEHHATLDGKQVRLIPTGLRIKLAPNMVGLLLERGSVIKTPFVKRAGVIDPGYTDEIFVNLASLGSPYILRPGDKLPVQLVVVPCDNQFTEVTQSEWTTLTSTAKRGDGKVGSSN
jgi:dUTPase